MCNERPNTASSKEWHVRKLLGVQLNVELVRAIQLAVHSVPVDFAPARAVRSSICMLQRLFEAQDHGDRCRHSLRMADGNAFTVMVRAHLSSVEAKHQRRLSRALQCRL